MIPIKLSLAGFLSYRQPVTLDFSKFDLACISGANGAGKSSLLDAFTWVLFGQARKRDESIINTASDVAEVTLDFEYEENVYRVHRVNKRGKGASVDFLIQTGTKPDGTSEWKPLSERTMRDTDAQIVKTLRLDYETFINASFFLQGKADQFAQQRPGDRKRILGSILGLDVWETYRKQTAAERSEKEKDLDFLDGRLKDIQDELSQEKERKLHLDNLNKQLAVLSTSRENQAKALEEMKKLERSLQDRVKLLTTLADQLEGSKRSRETNTELIKAREEELITYQDQLAHASEIEAEYKALLKVRQELSEFEKLAENFREIDSRRHEPLRRLEAERARLGQEIKNLETSLAVLESNEKNIPALENQVTSIESEIQKAQKLIGERNELEEEIKTLQQQQADARAENPRLRTEMEEIKSRRNELQKTEGAECPICGQPLSESDRNALLSTLFDEGTAKGDRFRANEVLLTEIDARMAEKEGQLAQLKKADEVLRNATRQSDQVKNQLDQIKTQRETWDKQNATHLSDLRSDLASESFLPDMRQQLAGINAELKTLGYDSAAHEALRQLDVSKRDSEAAFNALGNARAALVPLEREIAGLRTQLKKQNADIESLQKSHDESAVQIAAEQAQLPDIHTAENELQTAREEENRLIMAVGAARQNVEVLESQRQRQKELNEEREELSRLIEQYKLLERSFGKDGVPALLIEQALPEIEEHANQTLSRLSNNSMSIHFPTQRDYKDAHREDKKETLDILISDGSGQRDYEMFSGGEAFKINFAIRLALSRILSQRAGA
ncbi:MAG: SMC family ATPase, partial [Anaerolineaceae bacterium]|nr:SMC family ATPase [Anaerolineaceae bacterium]